MRREETPKVFEPKQGAQKFEFQAEVSRLMDIIIHSLYSNKVLSAPHMNALLSHYLCCLA